MSFTCPFCETTSHHPMDDRELYCNRCRLFLEEAPAIWVVWSFEHGAWWGPGRWGYVAELREAGRFTQREAEQIEREANVVAVNERALAWVEAQRHGSPVISARES